MGDGVVRDPHRVKGKVDRHQADFPGRRIVGGDVPKGRQAPAHDLSEVGAHRPGNQAHRLGFIGELSATRGHVVVEHGQRFRLEVQSNT